MRSIAAKVLLGLVGLGLSATGAEAVPAFAVQTGQPCETCHVGGFGPQLTPFGRNFKLHGYTQRAVGFNVPISVMAVASYVHTQQDQPPPATHFATDNNWAVDQISVFVAGGLGDHLGAFVQTTYDGVAEAFTWDNLDVRAVTTTTLGGTDVLLGLDVNNNPTVQEVWNTLPAWGFPYTSSALQPGAPASPMIGNLAQTTMGVTAYAWINSQIYIEGGGYASPSAHTLMHLGADPTAPGNINGVAPYVRVAYEKNYGSQNWQVGAFGMTANIFPGNDQTTGYTDHYGDLGVDASYQKFYAEKSVLTFNSRYTFETQNLPASQALGISANSHDTLQDVRADVSYYYHSIVGGTVQLFDTWGSADEGLYADDRTFTPNTSGIMFQIDGTPWGRSGSPLGKRFNMRVGAQYWAYFNFDGAGSNYDGFGRSASANNTFRLFTWIAY